MPLCVFFFRMLVDKAVITFTFIGLPPHEREGGQRVVSLDHYMVDA